MQPVKARNSGEAHAGGHDTGGHVVGLVDSYRWCRESCRAPDVARSCPDRGDRQGTPRNWRTVSSKHRWEPAGDGPRRRKMRSGELGTSLVPSAPPSRPELGMDRLTAGENSSVGDPRSDQTIAAWPQNRFRESVTGKPESPGFRSQTLVSIGYGGWQDEAPKHRSGAD